MSPSSPTTASRLRAIVVLIAILAIGGLALDRLHRDGELVPRALLTSVGQQELGSGDTREVLLRLRALYSIPFVEADGDRILLAERYTATPPSPERLAAALRIDPEWLTRDVSIVSLLMDEDDYSELDTNFYARGREWERPGFFAFVENGELAFGSGVGVRIHGGWSRSDPENRSYRIYFRNSLGVGHFPLELFDTGGSLPARVLIIRDDHGTDQWGRTWQFVNPIGFDICRRIGCLAPRTKTVVFFLNGKYMGIDFLVERMDEKFLESHFGHDSFSLVRTDARVFVHEKRMFTEPKKVDMVRLGPVSEYLDFVAWLDRSPELSMADAGRVVDLENLTNWFVAVFFIALHEAYQGPQLKDLTVEDSRWFWIAWDNDRSLGFTLRHPQTGWQGRTFRNLARGTQSARYQILSRLLRHSPEYREYLAHRFVNIMNHSLTDEYLLELVEHYRREAERHHVTGTRFLDFIEEFMRRRPRRIYRQVQGLVQMGPAHELSVEIPAERTVSVNGFEVSGRFKGRYFEGMRVELAVDPATARGFSHWILDGERIPQPSVSVIVGEDKTVQAVFGS